MILIAFEGVEGAGKSYQSKVLCRRLKRKKIPCILIREPGGTPLGERIRRLLKSHEMSPEAELFLFSAARAQLISDLILPSLNENKVLILDRFSPSTLAYQAYGRGLKLEDVERVNLISTRGISPDLTILLDLPVQEGLGRKGNALDRFEAEGIDFHLRVREGYLKLARAEPDRWLILDACLPPRKISSLIWREVKKLLMRNWGLSFL